MNNILQVLKLFKPVSLIETENVKLFDRIDLKYVFSPDLLPDILSSLHLHYDILNTGNDGLSKYESRYFDTPNYQMYINHHNGLKNRNKVRFRRYIDTGNVFFEIKQKTNRERTVKTRIEVTGKDFNIKGPARAMLHNTTNYQADSLSEVLIVRFNRISLISKTALERVTLDLELQYDHSGKIIDFPGVVIAEVKQQKATQSFFREVMRSNHILPFKISKYCLGMAAINPSLKSNNFKRALMYVDRLSKNNN